MQNRNLLVNQINTKQQRSHRCVHQLHRSAGEKHGNNAEDHQNNGSHKQHTAHHGEIPFRLESEQGETQANGSGDTDGKQDLQLQKSESEVVSHELASICAE